MEKKFNKRVIIYIAAAIIAVVVISVFILMSGGKGETWQEHYDLGQQYLVELSYDKAVLEFTDAIKIDPKNADPYIGLADAYIGLGDTAKAVETLETGLAETGDDRISKRLEELKGDDAPDASEENNAAEAETETQTEAVTETEAAVSETEDNRVEVPDLSGMSEEEAAEACIAVGLTSSVSRSNSSDVEKGFVISQTIPAGTKVNAGISVPFTVSEGEKEAIKVELKAENLDFDYLANFEESGWAFAVKGNRGGYVNVDGEFVEVYDVPEKEDEYLEYWTWGDGVGFAEGDGEWYNFESPFRVSVEGLYPYYDGNKWGYADINSGKVVIPCQYDEVTAFSCGRALVGTDTEYLTDFSIVDKNGKTIPCKEEITYTLSSGFINNVAFVRTLGGKGDALIDINGNVIDDNVKSQIAGGMFKYNDKEIVYESEDYMCHVITPELKILDLFSNESYNYGCAICGNLILYWNSDTDKYFIYNIDDCKIIGQFDADNYYGFNTKFASNRIARYNDDNKWSLFDFNGNKLISEEYDFVGNPKWDLISVTKDGKCGFIDTSGNHVIDYLFDHVYWILPLNDNSLCFVCKQGDNVVIIDDAGNNLCEINGEFVTFFDVNNKDKEQGYVLIKNDNGYSIYSFNDLT